jgi:hypothetical protein
MRTVVIRMDGRTGQGGDIPVHVYDASPAGAQLAIEDAKSVIRRTDIDSLRGIPMDVVQKRTENADEVGSRLFTMLCAAVPGFGGLLSCDACPGSTKEHLRVYLDIADAEVAELPWEYAKESPVKRGVFATTQPGHSFLRGRPGAPVHDGRRDERLPVRILVLVAADADDCTAEREIRLIYRAARRRSALWWIHVLRQPGWAETMAEVVDFPPDIVHVIGHHDDTDGGILFTPGPGEWLLNRASMLTLFPDGGHDPDREPRLFFLNSCNSVDLVPKEWFDGAADRAVVATQFGIRNRIAAEFAAAFYDEVTESVAIADAVRAARERLVRLQAVNQHDWGIPRLHMTGDADAMLPGSLARAFKHYDARARELKCAAWPTFDRTADHKEIWRSVYRRVARPAYITAISGDPDVGKSELVKSCVLNWRLDGRTVAYVDLSKDPKRRSVGEAAHMIATEICAGLERLPGTASADNRARLAAFEQHATVEDEGELDPDRVRGLFDHLLRQWPSTGRDPLLIVLDHVESVPADHQAATEIEQQLTRTAHRGGGSVHLLVVAENRRAKYLFRSLIDETADSAPDEEVNRFVVEALAARNAGLHVAELASKWMDEFDPTQIEALATAVRGRREGPLYPDYVVGLVKQVKKFGRPAHRGGPQ